MHEICCDHAQFDSDLNTLSEDTLLGQFKEFQFFTNRNPDIEPSCTLACVHTSFRRSRTARLEKSITWRILRERKCTCGTTPSTAAAQAPVSCCPADILQLKLQETTQKIKKPLFPYGCCNSHFVEFLNDTSKLDIKATDLPAQ